MIGRRNILGFALLETVLLTAVILPILFGIIAFADYLYITSKIKRLVVNVLPEINLPVLTVQESSTGSYFDRINSDNLKVAFDSQGILFANRIATALDVDPVTQKSFYRVEMGFAGYYIDVRSGNLLTLGGGSVPGLATWGSSNPPSLYNRNKAIYAKCVGGLSPLFTDSCPPHLCLGGNCGGDPNSEILPAAVPAFGESALYDKLMELGVVQPVQNNNQFKVMGIASPHKGAMRQVYYGEDPEVSYAASTNQQLLTDNRDHTVHNYFRHSVVFGVHLSVDLRYRFTGKAMEALGLNPIFSINHLAVPRAFF